ncbi:MAG TPA: DEAD/DEAH box helicase, partial [Candidatus Bathyarchaeia archaeon]|nr:DEAD/DEAH box helicase [Candidatus Bathyarchaeia archaeon]
MIPAGIEAREYQRSIADSALKGNTLVVLPTGLGKTIIALLVAVERLARNPGKKALILAPTRPLVLQHSGFFE